MLRASLKKNFRFAGAARAVALRCKLGQYGKYSRFACALRASPRRSHRITEILFEKRSKRDCVDIRAWQFGAHGRTCRLGFFGRGAVDHHSRAALGEKGRDGSII